MSRNPLIEAIHSARYELETCAPHEQAAVRAKLDALVVDALSRSGSKVTPRQVLDLLFEDYKEFRRMKRRQEWPRLR